MNSSGIFRLCAVSLFLTNTVILAATPAASQPAYRRIPPPGITLKDADRDELQAGVDELGKSIDSLPEKLKADPAHLELLPDVQIYFNAVRYALAFHEFFSADQVKAARKLLKEGQERARELADGQAPWTKASGLVVRGYVSKIDGSVQPYGLVIPPTFEKDRAEPRRLDVWYHGRGETLNEIAFLTEHEKSPGQFTPDNTFVLHTYGRYCNGNRFAGEVDTFEALQAVRKHYVIDENRTLVRGFSMGGAACWLFATHHPSDWACAAPGAGYTETAHFLKIEDVNTVPWYQRKLWHMYDSIDYAVNLFNCPTVAYSGEIDGQKQAADEMAKAMDAVGLKLEHIIGPKTKHAYEPKAKLEVARRVDEIAAKGRNPSPDHVKITTWTLKYNRSYWVQIDGLEHHWERANVEAIRTGQSYRVTTSNVTYLTLYPLPTPGRAARPIEIDGQPVTTPPQEFGAVPMLRFSKPDGKWSLITAAQDSSLRKRHNLQGPIDDAFMDSFIFVRPTGKAMHEKTAAWVAAESAHAISQWRSVFRGEARVKDDTAIDDSDIAHSNLILWGDPASNAVLKKILDKLPIKWDAQNLTMAGKVHPSSTSVAVMVYPNPLNPNRYVVLNSGHTFREVDLVNNDRQNSKLPDWAVIDATTGPTGFTAGDVLDAGFFGEQWEYTPQAK